MRYYQAKNKERSQQQVTFQMPQNSFRQQYKTFSIR